MLLNAVPNPAGRFSKLDPSPLNCAAVIIPEALILLISINKRCKCKKN